MKKLVRKDFNKRQKCFSKEKRRIILKNIKNNCIFSIKIRYKANSNLFLNFKKDSFNQTVNRCILTGRKKRLNNLYSFSRISFLHLVRSGFIFGLKKSSW